MEAQINEAKNPRNTNIFKYVKPKAIYIKREDGADRVIALLV